VLFFANNVRITWWVFIKLLANNLELAVVPSFRFVTSYYQQYELIFRENFRCYALKFGTEGEDKHL